MFATKGPIVVNQSALIQVTTCGLSGGIAWTNVDQRRLTLYGAPKPLWVGRTDTNVITEIEIH